MPQRFLSLGIPNQALRLRVHHDLFDHLVAEPLQRRGILGQSIVNVREPITICIECTKRDTFGPSLHENFISL